MNNVFKPLSARDFDDYQLPVWDGRLLKLDWYVPVPQVEMHRVIDRYSLHWLTYHNDMRDTVVSSYAAIRDAFLAGVLYDITAYQYRFFLSALIYDVMDAVWDSNMPPRDILYMMHLLNGYGKEAQGTVATVCLSRFNRHVNASNWNEQKAMMQDLFLDIDPKIYEFNIRYHWSYCCLRMDDGATFRDFLLARLMDETTNVRYLQNDDLALFVARTVRTVVSQTPNYDQWYYEYNGIMTINQSFTHLVNRVINRTYIRLFAKHGDPLLLKHEYKEMALLSSFPEFFSIKNIDTLVDKAIDSSPDYDLKVVQGVYQISPWAWRDELAEIIKLYKEEAFDVDVYINKVNDLATRAKLCDNVQTLYKEAMKRLGKKNRMHCARLYLQAAMAKRDFTATKSIEKVVFSNEVSHDRFMGIITDFWRDHDRKKAEKRIEYLYEPERKRIVISRDNLATRQENQHKTVGMLDDILREEEPVFSTLVASQPATTGGSGDEVIEFFRSHGFTLNEQQLESLARQLGTMPALLVDMVNEKYYDVLDDNLIEQEGDEYVMNQEYIVMTQVSQVDGTIRI